MLSGDLDWLKGIWPQVKRSIAFTWSAENPDRWDLDRDGLIEGRQHHTLDVELFGPNSWLSGMYLTGLQAAARLARILGEPETALEYEEMFRRGREKLNETLFNGSYFVQRLDLTDRGQLAPYDDGTGEIYDAYWDDETGEIRHQIGEGCEIDQVLGQWHADLLGLDRTFDRDKTASALRAIYRNNYIPLLREYANPCRIYGLNDEAGTVICSYCFNRELPASGPVVSTQTWGHSNSQESVGISPEQYAEFVFPYIQEIAKEFGLFYYGCCEPVDPIWDDCLSKLPNLRKVSISAWCDEEKMAERLTKAPVIYSRKPSPNYLGVDHVLDEEAFRAYIKRTIDLTRDCHVEIIFRDIYTLHGNPAKARRAVEIVRSLL